jgi:hypothetical protein
VRRDAVAGEADGPAVGDRGAAARVGERLEIPGAEPHDDAQPGVVIGFDEIAGRLGRDGFTLLDVVGLDVSLAIQQTLYREFREPGFAPAPLLNTGSGHSMRYDVLSAKV